MPWLGLDSRCSSTSGIAKDVASPQAPLFEPASKHADFREGSICACATGAGQPPTFDGWPAMPPRSSFAAESGRPEVMTVVSGVGMAACEMHHDDALLGCDWAVDV